MIFSNSHKLEIYSNTTTEQLINETLQKKSDIISCCYNFNRIIDYFKQKIFWFFFLYNTLLEGLHKNFVQQKKKKRTNSANSNRLLQLDKTFHNIGTITTIGTQHQFLKHVKNVSKKRTLLESTLFNTNCINDTKLFNIFTQFHIYIYCITFKSLCCYFIAVLDSDWSEVSQFLRCWTELVDLCPRSLFPIYWHLKIKYGFVSYMIIVMTYWSLKNIT